MLFLHNTLTRRKERFTPLDPASVRMYVCGPTVYDRPHLGNARSVAVYDVLFRLLRHLYGAPHVTYVRNITDVDDKINEAARANGEPISALAARVEGWFHADMAALGALPPTHEPRATGHIAEMIAIINRLVDAKAAYVAQKHVLFNVASCPDYGALSGRVLDDLIAGARVGVESYKRNAQDFVLWKPADPGDDPSSVFASPWGPGRPGWHIECSAMSTAYLGETFDLHGGGADLMFPHHENEIAQSRCAFPHGAFAKHWVHNGFLTVNGEKMSKSLGNFITVHDVLEKGVRGEVIRYALLSAKYNEPLDWTQKLLDDAQKTLDRWYRALQACDPTLAAQVPQPFLEALCDDLNLPKAFAAMHAAEPQALCAMGWLLGFFGHTPQAWFQDGAADGANIQAQIEARLAARKARNWAEADRIRDALAGRGIVLEDRPDGTTDWRKTPVQNDTHHLRVK